MSSSDIINSLYFEIDDVTKLDLSSSIKQLQQSVDKILNMKNKEIKDADNEFINSCIPKLINKILNSRPHGKHTAAVNKVLEYFVSIFSDVLVNGIFENFITSILNIFLRKQAYFYSSDDKSHSSISQIYERNVECLQESKFFTKIEKKFKANKKLSLVQIYSILALVSCLKNYLKPDTVTSIISLCISCLTSLINELNESDLRDIDEKKINNCFDILDKMDIDNDKKESLKLLKFNLSLRYTISNYLNKQFIGITEVANELSKGELNKEVLCKRIKESKFIKIIYNDIRSELISNYYIILKVLIKQNLISEEEFKEIYEQIFSKTSNIDLHLSGIEMIYKASTTSFKELIWNHIIETDNYSIILLRFIRNIASYEKDKDRIVLLDKLNNMYFKIDDNKDYKDAYYNAIDAVMLNDPNVCKSIREKCYSLITKQENLEFALNLLQFSCKNIEPDEVKNALKNVFDLIRNVKIDNEFCYKIIQIIKKLLKNISELDDELFQQLSDASILMLDYDSNDVCEFYRNYVTKLSVFNCDNVLTFISNLEDKDIDENTLPRYVLPLLWLHS